MIKNKLANRNILRAYSEKIIIASGPVIVENNKVLLDKHGEDNFWKFCGGTVEQNENLTETAKRQAGEELGIGVEILDSKPFIMAVQKEKNGNIFDVILVHFLSRRIGDIKPGEEIREWKWLDLDSLPQDLAPNIRPALEHFKFI